MKKVLFYWLFAACIVTFVCFACYGIAQQMNRQSADEPQVQMAYDAALSLEGGASAASLVTGNKTDVSQSLSPFIIIYDENKNVIASSAVLDGAAPSLPSGILDKTPQNGDSRVTWQPRAGLRFATVTVRTAGNGGFVVAGRSLYETESRIDKIGRLIFLGWAAGLLGFFVIILVLAALFGFLKKDKADMK